MNNFSLIVDGLRSQRDELLQDSKKRRTTKGVSRKKPKKKIDFDSKMLEDLFGGMPQDMQEYLKGKIQK